MNDSEFETWNAETRQRAVNYLDSEGISNPNVGAYPAFEVSPYFGVWCVESKKQEGKIGWWVFAGDCPTDYVSENGKCNPRSAVEDLVSTWESYIPKMKQGLQPTNCRLGTSSNLVELGSLLEKRVLILKDWLNDSSLWEDR